MKLRQELARRKRRASRKKQSLLRKHNKRQAQSKEFPIHSEEFPTYMVEHIGTIMCECGYVCSDHARIVHDSDLKRGYVISLCPLCHNSIIVPIGVHKFEVTAHVNWTVHLKLYGHTTRAATGAAIDELSILSNYMENSIREKARWKSIAIETDGAPRIQLKLNNAIHDEDINNYVTDLSVIPEPGVDPEEQYLESNGTECPICGSTVLSIDKLDEGNTSIVQCLTCGSTWTAIWELKGMDNLTAGIRVNDTSADSCRAAAACILKQQQQHEQRR